MGGDADRPRVRLAELVAALSLGVDLGFGQPMEHVLSDWICGLVTGRTWKATLARCRKDLGEDAPPVITIHDLRHTHASLLLSAGEPVKTVSERLGHASVAVTLTIYAHVMPGDQKRAASRFAALLGEA